MEHVVFFPAADGTPAFRRVATLEDAVRLVEQLRNVEGVHEVSVHGLGGEVPLAFRTWYRVEVPTGQSATDAERDAVAAPLAEPVDAPVALVPEQMSADLAEAAPVQAAAEPVPALVGEPASNGHAPDGEKSLGFFA